VAGFGATVTLGLFLLTKAKNLADIFAVIHLPHDISEALTVMSNVPAFLSYGALATGLICVGYLAWDTLKKSGQSWPRSLTEHADNRISVHEFMFTESPKVGWQNDGPDANTDFTVLLNRLRQAGVDGTIHFWGKNPPSSWLPDMLEGAPLLPILDTYWHDHEIDIRAIFRENNSQIYSRLEFGDEASPEDRYYDLHLGRKEALAWLRSGGRP
jgi:hypothetical protein